MVRKENEGVSVKQDKEVLTFNTEEIDEIVEARLEEIFDAVNKELKKLVVQDDCRAELCW